MAFTITMTTDNDAFSGEDRNREVARILQEIAACIEQGRESGIVRDINGNKVGEYGFERAPVGLGDNIGSTTWRKPRTTVGEIDSD